MTPALNEHVMQPVKPARQAGPGRCVLCWLCEPRACVVGEQSVVDVGVVWAERSRHGVAALRKLLLAKCSVSLWM